MNITVVSANQEDNLGDKLIYESLAGYLTNGRHLLSPVNFRLQYYDKMVNVQNTKGAKETLKQWTAIYIILQCLYFVLRLPKYFRLCVGSYKGSDIVIIGGGQLIMDSPKSLLSPLNMLFHVVLSKIFVGRYAFVGIGLADNFSHLLTKKIFQYCLRGAEKIICRDIFSFQRCLLYVPNTSKVKLGSDLAMLTKLDEKYRSLSPDKPIPIVGISTLAYYDKRYYPIHDEMIFFDYKQRFLRLIKNFSIKNKIVLIPTTSVDCVVAKEIDESLVLYSKNIHDLIKNIGACDLFIATRMHSFIIATLFGIPSVCMNWDDKVRGYAYGLFGFDAENYLFSYEEMQSAIFIVQKFSKQSIDATTPLLASKRRELQVLIDELVSK